MSHQPKMGSGFSATLFQNKHSAEPGEFVFANRRTEGSFADIVLADIFGIVLLGKATHQIVDMYRYFRRLETTAGQEVVYTEKEIALLKNAGQLEY